VARTNIVSTSVWGVLSFSLNGAVFILLGMQLPRAMRASWSDPYISNTVLNHFTSGYSNAAMAGMGIAKKVNLLAFAVGQGITQGTLPLIGYNYTSGNRQRMLKAIYGLLVGCLAVSLLITILLYFGATPITRWFINDAETVSHGCTFLQIICLTCPTSTFIFFAITVFQATGKRAQPIFLSLVRKGTTDVLLMPLFYHLIGINGVAWASPAADLVGVLIALAVLLPYLRRLRQMPASPAPEHS